MQSFTNISIKRKLTLVILASCVACLLLACAGFSAYEYVSYRMIMEEKLDSLAAIVSENIAASLAFDNKEDADRILEAFKHERQVLAVKIWRTDGTLFSSYEHKGFSIPDNHMHQMQQNDYEDSNYIYPNGTIAVTRTIRLDGEDVGKACIFSNLSSLYEKLHRYLVIACWITLGAALAALLISQLLQRVISNPILKLANITQKISEDKDYSIRLQRQSDDEIGTLVDSINTMMEQIHQRDLSLLEAHQELEERVRMRTEELAIANAELTQFAQIASHDFQEPLRKIRTFGDRLKRNFSDNIDERMLGDIERMQSSSQRIQRLIDDWLLFSNITAKGKPAEKTDLNEVLTNLLNDIAPQIKKSETTISASRLPTIEADPYLMRQLFAHILDNSIKFRKLNYPLRITINSEKAEKNDNLFVITISDNGMGFDNQYRIKIFRIFQKIHTYIDNEGSGIGLAIAKKIVEHHRGSITAQGSINEGAVFRIYLPYQQRSRPGYESTRIRVKPPLHEKTSEEDGNAIL